MPADIKDSQISVRIPNELKGQMETYARLTGRTMSYVAMEAVGEYLSWRVPQVEDLKEAVLAAERGDFASDEEVNAVLAKYAARKPTRRSTKVASVRGKR